MAFAFLTSPFDVHSFGVACRPSVSRDCGTLRPRTQLLFVLGLAVIGGTSCSALAMFTVFLLHLYRVNFPTVLVYKGSVVHLKYY